MVPAALEDKEDVLTLLADAPEMPEQWASRMAWQGSFEHDLYQRNAAYLGALSYQFFAWYYLRRHFEFGIADYQVEIFNMLGTLREGRNVELLLPRGHGKSTLCTFGLSVWHTCYRTKKHIGIVSSTNDLAQKFLGKVANELRNNELIKRDFGDLSGLDAVGNKEIWRQSKLRTANQVVLFAIGTGGSVRGMNESLPEDIHRDYIGRDRHNKPQFANTTSYRPDLLIFDDIVEMKWLKSKRVRDWVEDWFLTSAVPAIDARRGNIIVVGTTLHDDDLVSRLYRDRMRTQAWLKMKRPACEGFDEHCNPIKPLWPGYWSLPDTNKPLDSSGRLLPLEEAEYRLKYQNGQGVYYLSYLWWKKIELGSKAFAQEFLLNPLADGLKLFDRAWVRYYLTRDAVITPAQEQALINAGIRVDILPDDLIAVTTVDPASSRGQQALENNSDFSVVSTIGYSPKMRRFYLLDIDRVRTTPAALMQILLRHYMVYNNQYGGKMFTDRERTKAVTGHPCEHLGIVVETVGYQKALAISLDELATTLGMYPKVIEVKRGRSDKKVRATSASPLFENGQVYWPCLLLGNLKQDFEEALQELDRFPEAEHDDCVDSLCDALNFLNRMSLSLNRGLAAQVAMREMIRQSPELYAYVSKQEASGTDMQDAVNQYRQRN